MNTLLSDGQPWHVHHGDCIPHMHAMPPASVDFSIFSPPFPAVYSYTSEACDIGNSEELKHEAKLHFSFFLKALRKVVKPGRIVAIHCQQIIRMKRTGGSGMFDFRGLLIRLAQRAGFIYDYDWLIPKNPQAQAIRTKSRAMQFAGLESDRAQSRGAMGDYIIKLIVPGENRTPISSPHQVTRNDWIAWAEGAWAGIREADTLNVAEARSKSDVRHICALQLAVIDRLVRLYSNPDEIVFSPFAGIGSEGYTALKLGRRFYGCELKAEYFAAAQRNLTRATEIDRAEQVGLFTGAA